MSSIFLCLVIAATGGDKANRALRQEGARYLIITPDNFYDAVVPLAEWKTKKGMKARIATLSETGSTASQIRSYIQNAYNSWDPRPEYVLLVGSSSFIPFPYYGGAYSDDYYADMDGDIYNEIYCGRFSVISLSEVQTIVAKTLAYERTPYIEDTTWLGKATLIVREDGDWSDSYYWGDTYHIASLMYSSGFAHLDTFSYFQGDDYTDVRNAVNEGRAFVTFRGSSVCGWWYPFNLDPSTLSNGFKLPIVTSLTCGQVDPTGVDCGERWVRAGTPETPKGAVAFCGPTTVIVWGAHLRSAIIRGFYDYVFTTSGDSICNLGKALNAGKINVYQQYGSLSEFRGFTLIGDPELNVWTGRPKEMEVSYPNVVTPEDSVFCVSVTSDSEPVPYALVCIMTESTIYEYGYTDENGEICFSISPIPSSEETLFVTVTARNCLPFEGYALKGVCGDANGDLEVTAADVIYILNWISGGPSLSSCWAANVDGLDSVTAADALYLMNWFAGGEALNCTSCESSSSNIGER